MIFTNNIIHKDSRHESCLDSELQTVNKLHKGLRRTWCYNKAGKDLSLPDLKYKKKIELYKYSLEENREQGILLEFGKDNGKANEGIV